MSYALSAAAQRLSTTISLQTSAFTLQGWVKRDVDRNTFSAPLVIDDGTVNNYALIGTDGTGDVLFIEQQTASPVSDDTVAGPTVTNTDWVFVCFRRDGAGANSGTFYYSVGLAPALSSASVTVSQSFTASRITLGDHGTSGEFWSGKIAHVKLWNRALTLAEIVDERAQAVVRSTSGLIGHWLVSGSSDHRQDWSGNGHTLTGSGGSVSLLDPTVLARPMKRRIYDVPAAAAGGSFKPSWAAAASRILGGAPC